MLKGKIDSEIRDASQGEQKRGPKGRMLGGACFGGVEKRTKGTQFKGSTLWGSLLLLSIDINAKGGDCWTSC